MKRLFIYIVLVTWLLAQMDWQPIHSAWWHHGKFPDWALGDFQKWARVRFFTALILCPPCAPLAENYYYVLMEVEAGEEEQAAVLPVEYTHNPLNPHGDWTFRWGQGEGREWRRVSMISLYLWWLPYSVIWWLVVRRLFK